MTEAATQLRPAPAGEQPPGRRWSRRALPVLGWLVVALGLAVRLSEWLRSGSFWLDEQYVALVLRDTPYQGLTGVLLYGQSGPVGWLWTEKLILSASGGSELAMRLPSLAAGCAALLLMMQVARRLFRAPAAIALVALAAGAPLIVYYSAVMKPYAIDVAVTTGLLLLAITAARSPAVRSPAARSPAARFAVPAFWVTAAVAIWFSQTAAFTAAGCGAVLGCAALIRRDRRAVARHVVWALPAVASVAGLYQLQVRHNIGSVWLVYWWSNFYPNSFGPRPVTFYGLAVWTVKVFGGVVRLTLGIGEIRAAAAVLALAAVGAVLLLRRDPVVGALVLGPLALGYGFALARLYPMADRVALWLAPLFLVLICVPVDAATAALVRWWADRRASGRRPDLRAAVAAMVAAGTVAVLLAAFAAPVARGAAGTPLRRYARTEEALRFVARSAAPADKVYIHVHTVPAVLWYGDRVGLRWEGRFDLAAQPQDCPAQPLLAGVAESGELWLVLGLLGNDPVTLAMLHAELDRYGRSTGEWRYDGIVVVRYHRSETQPPPQPRPGCLLPGRRTYQG